MISSAKYDLMQYLRCRRYGHEWGERRWWGDAQRDRGGTHKCSRCGKIGIPDDISAYLGES